MFHTSCFNVLVCLVFEKQVKNAKCSESAAFILVSLGLGHGPEMGKCWRTFIEQIANKQESLEDSVKQNLNDAVDINSGYEETTLE